MIDRVESGVDAVDGMKERQEMSTAKDARKGPFQKLFEVLDTASSEAVDVSHELNLILHECSP
jgi:hypothetical protein